MYNVKTNMLKHLNKIEYNFPSPTWQADTATFRNRDVHVLLGDETESRIWVEEREYFMKAVTEPPADSTKVFVENLKQRATNLYKSIQWC